MKTDAELTKKAMAQLASKPSVYAELVGVEMRGGVLTPVGEVGNSAEKRSTERGRLDVEPISADGALR